MAYSNYGAYVYCNGEHRTDKEDCPLFEGQETESYSDLCHGLLGDGDIRVKCYKMGNPMIFEKQFDNTFEQVQYHLPSNKFEVKFEYKGYKFYFKSGKPNYAEMIEPDGTQWKCEYGYKYGAGWD